MNICKGHKKVIRCGSQQYIRVTGAQYGSLKKVCSIVHWGKCSGKNVLQTVRDECGLRSQSCELEASDSVLGSSGCYYGVYLRLNYECIGNS